MEIRKNISSSQFPINMATVKELRITRTKELVKVLPEYDSRITISSQEELTQAIQEISRKNDIAHTYAREMGDSHYIQKKLITIR